jgi:LacI family transcriptional regulator of maltose regulon
MPLVFASRASYLDDVDLIRPDNMQAAQIVTEHLIRRGHQRIAWLGGQSSSLTRAERVGGYCATLLKYGLPFHSEWVLECESSQKQAAEAMAALLRQNPTISAVLCYNSVIATGAWFGLMRAGRQSGEAGVESYFEQRVALAAFAELPEEALDDLPLTWVTTPGSWDKASRSVFYGVWKRDRARRETRLFLPADYPKIAPGQGLFAVYCCGAAGGTTSCGASSCG